MWFMAGDASSVHRGMDHFAGEQQLLDVPGFFPVYIQLFVVAIDTQLLFAGCQQLFNIRRMRGVTVHTLLCVLHRLVNIPGCINILFHTIMTGVAQSGDGVGQKQSFWCLIRMFFDIHPMAGIAPFLCRRMQDRLLDQVGMAICALRLIKIASQRNHWQKNE